LDSCFKDAASRNFVGMELPSRLMETAVDHMASLPGIGRKTALRLVLNMLRRSEAFAESLVALRQGIRDCQVCHNLTEQDQCSICEDRARDDRLICVVEDLRDLLAIEGTGQFRGLYHVLGGVISPMDGTGPNDLNIESLVERAASAPAQDGKQLEIIFALPTTMEGETTSFYLFRKLASCDVQVTAIARGVAVGDDLQHADEATLVQSIRQRLPYTQ
jgi:recombination protein RecR